MMLLNYLLMEPLELDLNLIPIPLVVRLITWTLVINLKQVELAMKTMLYCHLRVD